MDTFPIVASIKSLKVKMIKPSTRETSSAGYTLSRAAATVMKKEFTIDYSYISDNLKDTITVFFNANQGISFYLTEVTSTDSNAYVVIFNQDSLDWDYMYQMLNLWSTSIIFREV